MGTYEHERCFSVGFRDGKKRAEKNIRVRVLVHSKHQNKYTSKYIQKPGNENSERAVPEGYIYSGTKYTFLERRVHFSVF
jgi:hypothetical protein